MQMRGMDCGALDTWCGDHAWATLQSMHNTQMIGEHWRVPGTLSSSTQTDELLPPLLPPGINKFRKTAWPAWSAWPAWAPCWPAKRPHRAAVQMKHPARFSVYSLLPTWWNLVSQKSMGPMATKTLFFTFIVPPRPFFPPGGIRFPRAAWATKVHLLLSLFASPPPAHLVELGFPEQHGHRAGLPLVAVHHVRLPPRLAQVLQAGPAGGKKARQKEIGEWDIRRRNREKLQAGPAAKSRRADVPLRMC